MSVYKNSFLGGYMVLAMPFSEDSFNEQDFEEMSKEIARFGEVNLISSDVSMGENGHILWRLDFDSDKKTLFEEAVQWAQGKDKKVLRYQVGVFAGDELPR